MRTNTMKSVKPTAKRVGGMWRITVKSPFRHGTLVFFGTTAKIAAERYESYCREYQRETALAGFRSSEG